jgi:hypothetical protein
MILEGKHILASGTWYLIQANDGYSNSSGTDPAGWVTEERLLGSTVHREPDCPSGRSLADVLPLGQAERLACYGGQSITFAPSMVTREFARSAPLLAADWLNMFHASVLLADIGLDGVPLFKWLAVTGRFDQPGKLGCTRSAPDGEPDLVWLECRERFVVSRAVRTRGPEWELAGSWRRIPPAPISGGFVGASVWTGREMLVMTFDGRAAYDPQRDQWRRLPNTGLSGRNDLRQSGRAANGSSGEAWAEGTTGARMARRSIPHGTAGSRFPRRRSAVTTPRRAGPGTRSWSPTSRAR